MVALGEQLGDLGLDTTGGAGLKEVHPEQMEVRRQALKAPGSVLLATCLEERDPLLPGIAPLDATLEDTLFFPSFPIKQEKNLSNESKGADQEVARGRWGRRCWQGHDRCNGEGTLSGFFWFGFGR